MRKKVQGLELRSAKTKKSRKPKRRKISCSRKIAIPIIAPLPRNRKKKNNKN